MSEEPDDFKVWTANQPTSPNYFGLEGATIKKGRDVCKTVEIALYGDPSTGEVRSRVLRFATFRRAKGGSGFDFQKPEDRSSWFCEDKEIDKLLAFLKDEVDQPGRYRVIDAQSPVAELLHLVKDRPSEVTALLKVLSAQTDPALIGKVLAQTEGGLSGAEQAVLVSRRKLLERVVALARTPNVTEPDLQQAIGDAWWIFGGRYIGVFPRRDLLHLDQHDIPLRTADGSLHIVELKAPRIPGLIRKHRNHWIVGDEVHEAAMQATNYIRTADELGLATALHLREELGIDIDLRRVFATVVIGHRYHADMKGMPEAQFDLALRTYNAHINRVQVITYDALFAAARRALSWTP